jgi:manganese/zinc-transporting P-type ATPase C
MMGKGTVTISDVELLHSLPGRMRIRLDIKLPSANIEVWFRSLPGIYSATYTPITKSVLLYYNDQFQIKYFIQQVRKLVRQRKDEEPSSIKRRLTFISLCTLLFGIHWILTRSSIPGNYLTVLNRIIGALVLLLSISTINEGVKGIVKEKRLNADFLTTASLFACLYLGHPASALIIYIMSTVSEVLTDMTTAKTKSYLHSLMNLEVPYAWKVFGEDRVEKVNIDEVLVNDLVKVYQGERIPVDGIIVSGTAVIDESAITGEYMPKEKIAEVEVYSGSVCQTGEVTILVTKTGRETALGRMIQLIESAYSSQAPTQQLANKMAEKMVGVSFALTIGTYLLTFNINRALSMLVIDFVCGIKLSTAAAFSAAIGKAAKKGILIKDGSCVEQLAKVETMVFDKTGTITEGSPCVSSLECFNLFSEEEVLSYAAALEQTSSHPLAHAIIEEAKKRKIVPLHRPIHDKTNVVTGKGISGIINGKMIHIGSLRYLEEQGFVNQKSSSLVKEYSVYVAIDGELAAGFSIRDRIRRGMQHTMKQLRLLGIQKVVMLTGDEKNSADMIAKKLPIDEYHARMLPEEKVNYVAYEKRRRTIAMVGDGLNDAPALTKAHIGITLGGKRTDLAVEASDVVVSSDNPLVLTDLVSLSQRTLRTVKQNVFATLFINGAAILFGALGILSPVAGAAVHNLATIGVVLNSMKILAKGEKNSETYIYCSSRHSWAAKTPNTYVEEPILAL